MRWDVLAFWNSKPSGPTGNSAAHNTSLQTELQDREHGAHGLCELSLRHTSRLHKALLNRFAEILTQCRAWFREVHVMVHCISLFWLMSHVRIQREKPLWASCHRRKGPGLVKGTFSCVWQTWALLLAHRVSWRQSLITLHCTSPACNTAVSLPLWSFFNALMRKLHVSSSKILSIAFSMILLQQLLGAFSSL